MKKRNCLLLLLYWIFINVLYAQQHEVMLLKTKPNTPIYEIKIIKENEWSFDVEVSASSLFAKDLSLTLTDYGLGEEITKIFYNQSHVRYTYKYMYYDAPFAIKIEGHNDYGNAITTYYNEGESYDVTSTGEVRLSNSILVYPNPFNSVIQFDIDYSIIKSLRIYNTSGLVVKYLSELNSNKINLQDLPTGVYFIHFVLEGENRIQQCKVIKH